MSNNDSLLDKVRQAEFWEELWNKSDPQGKQPIDRDKSIAMWNNRARRFAQNTANNQDNIARRELVFRFLADCGVELEGATVLDIGSGPGNYALPMAKVAKEVVVLDPAPNMLEIVKKRAEASGLSNISYISTPWEDIDLDALRWRGKFDLVFASVVPGVKDVPTLAKMIAASRKYCYLSKFAGERKNNIQHKIWQRLMGKSRNLHSMDVFLPWNLLYTWGYFPNTRFVASNWENQEPVDLMEQRMCDWFARFDDLPANYRQVIREVLEEEALDGMVKEEVKSHLGLMVWHV